MLRKLTGVLLVSKPSFLVAECIGAIRNGGEQRIRNATVVLARSLRLAGESSTLADLLSGSSFLFGNQTFKCYW